MFYTALGLIIELLCTASCTCMCGCCVLHNAMLYMYAAAPARHAAQSNVGTRWSFNADSRSKSRRRRVRARGGCGFWISSTKVRSRTAWIAFKGLYRNCYRQLKLIRKLAFQHSWRRHENQGWNGYQTDLRSQLPYHYDETKLKQSSFFFFNSAFCYELLNCGC